MRLLQVLVDTERLDDVLDALDEEDVDPVVLSVADDREFDRHLDGDADWSEDALGRKMVQFPVPTEAVDRIRDTITGVGIDEEYLVIVDAETASTPRYETLVDRYVEGSEEEERISNEEIGRRCATSTRARRRTTA